MLYDHKESNVYVNFLLWKKKKTKKFFKLCFSRYFKNVKNMFKIVISLIMKNVIHV